MNSNKKRPTLRQQDKAKSRVVVQPYRSKLIVSHPAKKIKQGIFMPFYNYTLNYCCEYLKF
jgi:hypothetical protein